MSDKDKSKKQLLDELTQLRLKVSEFENRAHVSGKSKDGSLDSKQKFEMITEYSSDLISLTETAGVITYASKASERIFGFTPGEMIGLHFTEFFDESSLPVAAKAFQDSIEKNIPAIGFELLMKRKDGTRFWGELNGSFSELSKLPGTLVVIRDIDKRKRSEEALRKSEERFRFLTENMADIIWTLDRDFKTTYVSQSVEKVLGFTPEERKKQLIEEMMTPESLQKVQEAFQNEILRDEKLDVDPERSITIETEYYHAVGHTVWMENNVKAIRDQTGAIIGMYGSSRDITDRKRAKEALINERDKAQKYLDIAGTMFVAINAAGEITLINRKGSEILGYKQKEIIGKNWFDNFLPENLKEQVKTVFHKLITGEIDHIEYYENSVLTKKGEERIIAWHNTILTNKEGQITGTLSSGEDITDKKQAEKERKKLQEQLIQSQKMEAIGRLAGGIAHDFNNLLTAIRGFSDLVHDSLNEMDPARKDVEEVQKASDLAAQLTQQLLAFSRKQIVAPKVVNLNKAVAQSEKMFKRIIGEDIDFLFIPDSQIGKAMIDPSQIDQILVNLAVNSRDAMPEGGKLTIETVNVSLQEKECRTCYNPISGEHVLLAVSDTGEGMNDEMMKKIFEPFFTTKEKGKGTGLGLSTVHGTVHQMGGHINVYSEPGQGTTFKIYLPRVDEKAVEILKATETLDTTGTETILLVEDQEIVRKLAVRALRAKGYNVIEAEDGKQALIKYNEQEGRIDLLLTDVVMPLISGKQLYEHLLKITPDLKSLFMSGYTENAIAHHGVLEKGTNFIQKPFRPIDLALKVREVLDN